MQTVEHLSEPIRPPPIILPPAPLSQDVSDVVMTLGRRLFRRALAARYVDPLHPVLTTDNVLVDEAVKTLRPLLSGMTGLDLARVHVQVVDAIRSAAEHSPVDDPEDPDLLAAVDSAESASLDIAASLVTRT